MAANAFALWSVVRHSDMGQGSSWVVLDQNQKGNLYEKMNLNFLQGGRKAHISTKHVYLLLKPKVPDFWKVVNMNLHEMGVHLLMVTEWISASHFENFGCSDALNSKVVGIFP